MCPCNCGTPGVEMKLTKNEQAACMALGCQVEAIADKIREMVAAWQTNQEIADKLCVSRTAIETWRKKHGIGPVSRFQPCACGCARDVSITPENRRKQFYSQTCHYRYKKQQVANAETLSCAVCGKEYAVKSLFYARETCGAIECANALRNERKKGALIYSQLRDVTKKDVPPVKLIDGESMRRLAVAVIVSGWRQKDARFFSHGGVDVWCDILGKDTGIAKRSAVEAFG